jgi:peptidyl-tRNA hydrolase, PTH1 family
MAQKEKPNLIYRHRAERLPSLSALKRETTDPEEIPISTSTSAAVQISKKKRQSRKSRSPTPPTPSPNAYIPSLPPPITAMITSRVPLLIVSIGNPGAQYAHTYHSAGHVLLSALQQQTPPRPDWEFWASSSYMNESGAGVARRLKKTRPGTTLVVLHDELERELGWVGVREGWASARGHNGVRSIQERLPRGAVWWRVGVGIGRPVSRRKEDVAGYVLGKMTGVERGRIEEGVGRVVELLGGIQDRHG